MQCAEGRVRDSVSNDELVLPVLNSHRIVHARLTMQAATPHH